MEAKVLEKPSLWKKKTFDSCLKLNRAYGISLSISILIKLEEKFANFLLRLRSRMEFPRDSPDRLLESVLVLDQNLELLVASDVMIVEKDLRNARFSRSLPKPFSDFGGKPVHAYLGKWKTKK